MPPFRDHLVKVLSHALIDIRADAVAQLSSARQSGLGEDQREALIGMLRQIDGALAQMDNSPVLEHENVDS